MQPRSISPRIARAAIAAAAATLTLTLGAVGSAGAASSATTLAKTAAHVRVTPQPPPTHVAKRIPFSERVVMRHRGRVNTFESCTYGSSSGNVNTCMYVNGTGLFVNYGEASGVVIDFPRTLEECIWYQPTGTYLNCGIGWVYVPVQGYVLASWSPSADEPSGNYCAVTWRQNSSGGPTNIGTACVSVHS